MTNEGIGRTFLTLAVVLGAIGRIGITMIEPDASWAVFADRMTFPFALFAFIFLVLDRVRKK